MTEECPPLLAVVFPATVKSDTTSLRAVKVFLSADKAWVAMDSPTGPSLVEIVPFTTLYTYGDKAYDLQKEDGTVVQIRQGGGCGCGSKLRSWTPFSGPLRVGT